MINMVWMLISSHNIKILDNIAELGHNMKILILKIFGKVIKVRTNNKIIHNMKIFLVTLKIFLIWDKVRIDREIKEDNKKVKILFLT